MTFTPSCLITGAAGFIGLRLAAEFRAAGYDVYGLDNRPTSCPELFSEYYCVSLEKAQLSDLMAGTRISVICHLAGSASVSDSMESPASDFFSSLPGTMNLLAWNGREGTRARILYFSSAAVYGEPKVLPIRESNDIAPISPYGIHKAAGELMVTHYANMYGFESLCIRPFSVFGEGLRKQVVYDIALKAKTAHDEQARGFNLFGTGGETRDFIYIADVGKIVLLLSTARLTEQNVAVNLASGIETPIRLLAEQIKDILGYKVTPNFSNDYRPGDPSRWVADVSLMKSLTNLELTPLAAALENFCQWFKDERQP